MNITLSIRRQRGMTSVRGGNAVRVARAHIVATSTLSTAEGELTTRWPDGAPEFVTAEPGDLALEFCHRRSGKVCGYSYLSGAALQLNLYDGAADWFAPATKRRFALPRPAMGGDPVEFQQAVIGTLMDVKYGGPDLAAFRYECREGESTIEVANALLHIFKHYGPAEAADSAEHRGHVLGVIEREKTGVVCIHFQPPDAVSDIAATQFQIRLALDACRE